MRRSSRLLATVKSASRFLETDAPTGLTGLSNHPAPRPALLQTYSRTLGLLNRLPTSSVYRQSCEALTKHRAKIIEDTVPEGYEAWHERVKKQIAASPAAYGKYLGDNGVFMYAAAGEEKAIPWDGEVNRKSARTEGSNTYADAESKTKEVEKEAQAIEKADKEGTLPTVDDLEPEPPLTRDQIHDIENKIGAGLIEEVIMVANGELELVEQMLKDRPWEELEEQSPPGQWQYFERGDRA